ncbi:BTAD domain-containing putative transcriptional regulator [Micromonospora sicca]|uniref:BTAD domain-containing putative transcriptional regulator n=1 Tax=Micromonospora sicca TaxID=2202420 RepID=UPI001F273614|nr:BTAD domain-containing putative transcriptional regulator [Micromonospora sp. 4G51]
MRWPRQVASLLFLALLLCGPPVVLVEIIGWPLDGWPSLRQAQLWVAQPLTEQTLTAALTLFAWLVWLFLAATVTVRVLARMRAGARRLRRVPLPTPLQATATGMAGAAAFGVGTHATTAPPDHPLAVAAGTLNDHGGADAAESSHLIDTPVSDGIVVSGGWLPRGVAEQVGAAAALVWLRRRRAYQPRPPGSEGRDEPDLTPLPAAVAAVQAALATGNTHPSSAEPAPAVTGDASGVLPAPVAGLPPTGVGLTGPGALAAARGVLVTVLLAGLRHPPGAAPIVITHTALTTLLGPAAETVRHRLPGMRVATAVDDAVALLESSASPTCPATPPAQRQEGAPPVGAHTPPVLIIEALLTPATADRLAAAVTVGAGVPVVLGEWSAGVTWQVDAAGHTHDLRQLTQAGPRLCVLDQVATTDLLTVIGHAHPPPPHARLHHSPEPPRPRVPRQATGAETTSRPQATTSVESGQLDLRVLGEPTLLVQGEPVTIRRSAAMQILVVLTVHRGGASSKQLVEAIWPGLPAHSLTGRLYTTLSDLRRTIRSACGQSVIDHTDDRYRINPAHLDADLWRLQSAVQHAATAVTDHDTAWQAVIDAYTGDLAAGYAWPWLEPAREATRRHIVDASVALASSESDPRRALALLQGGIRIDPYNEHLHLRAMKALAALGDHTGITDLCDSYTRRLAAAGLEPSGDLCDAAARLSSAHPMPGR